MRSKGCRPGDHSGTSTRGSRSPWSRRAAAGARRGGDLPAWQRRNASMLAGWGRMVIEFTVRSSEACATRTPSRPEPRLTSGNRGPCLRRQESRLARDAIARAPADNPRSAAPRGARYGDGQRRQPARGSCQRCLRQAPALPRRVARVSRRAICASEAASTSDACSSSLAIVRRPPTKTPAAASKRSFVAYESGLLRDDRVPR
jgi:hypothetical protein